MEKTVKLTKDTVVVTLKLEPYRPGLPKVRYYAQNAREWAQEAYPKLKLGRLLKNCTVRNQGSNNEGEWIFEVVKPPKKKFARHSAKKKEVVDAESSDGTE